MPFDRIAAGFILPATQKILRENFCRAPNKSRGPPVSLADT